MRYISTIIYFIITLLFIVGCSKKTQEPIIEKATDMVKEEMTESFRSNPPAPAPARKLQMGSFDQFELDNGLTVIVVENHKLPRVSYQVQLKNRAVQEGEKAGYVSITGQLLSRGTGTKTKAEIDEAVDFIGATLNTNGYGMYASSLTKHQDKLLSIASDVLLNPSFPAEEYDKIITQTLSGLEASKTEPSSMASNASRKINFGADHPYGEIETVESLGKIKIADSQNYYRQFFLPNNAYLIIVGDITKDIAKAKAEQYFGDWKKAPIKNWKYDSVKGPDASQVSFVNKDGAVQSSIRITYPVDLVPGDEDVIATSVMNSILGGNGFSGRLFQNLREDKAYTYGANSSLSRDPIVGNFSAFADVRSEVTDSSIVEFLSEMDRIKSEPVSAEDLENTKNYMAGNFALALESPQTIARYALNIARYDLPADYYETYLEKLDAVSVADIKRVAEKYIRPNNANIVVVGSKDDVADKLVKFDADGNIDFYDYKGDMVTAPAAVVPASLTAESVITSYIDKIGGQDKLKTIQSLKQVSSMSLMGQNMEVSSFQKEPGMFALEIQTGGMTVIEQRFDGNTLEVNQMGQKQVFTEGPEVDAMKGSAAIFPQLLFLSDSYSLELKGIENVNGSEAYKITAISANNQKITHFYDIESNLLIKQVTQQGEQALTQEMSDYRDVDGVLFPYKMSITGMAPVPVEMIVEHVEINANIAESQFVIKQ